MTIDVQLLLTTMLFTKGGLRYTWTRDGDYDYDAHARCALLIPAHLTAYSRVSSTFRSAFVRWKQTELLHGSHALVTHAVNCALRMCTRCTYPPEGVPWSSFLDFSLCLHNHELLAVRCVRDGKLRKHSLNPVVRKPGHQSSTWTTLTPKESWVLHWMSEEAYHDLELWQYSQRVALAY
jgi:hypothetical protein